MGRPQENLTMGTRFVGYAARNGTRIACPIIVKDTWTSEKPFQDFLEYRTCFTSRRYKVQKVTLEFIDILLKRIQFYKEAFRTLCD
jgi:hypothetical protein